MKWTPALRRSLDKVVRIRWCHVLYATFFAWTSLLCEEFPAKSRGTRGWKAPAKAKEYAPVLRSLRFLCAAIALNLRRWIAVVRDMYCGDRNEHCAQLARDIDRTAEEQKLRATYSVVRQLSGKKAVTAKALKQENGERVSGEAELERAWLQHYSSVFRTPPVDRCALSRPPAPPWEGEVAITCSPHDVSIHLSYAR